MEKKFETEKYAWIATEVEKIGGKNYPSSFIQKELKRLESTDFTYPATADTASTKNTALANTANDADQEETIETD